MPVTKGRDRKGNFYRWGISGKRYYYTAGSKRGRKIAANRAMRQGIAIHSRITRKYIRVQ